MTGPQERIAAAFSPDLVEEYGRRLVSVMASHLRVRPRQEFVRVPETATYFRYEREHGFDHAVEMCNGAGICRRLTPGGTMCPSYRALLDERHATRGRGNALRLAITGQLSADGRTPAWSDPETLETLRLCLSCKACKTECPSNVDISKLKAEYLARHWAHRGGPTLRSGSRLAFTRQGTMGTVTAILLAG